MRNSIFCLLFLAYASLGHSQILLEETQISYEPVSMKLDPTTNTLTIVLSEKEVGEFQKDPLLFVTRNFDIHRFLKENEDLNLGWTQVMFKSTKGHFRASYDHEGQLIYGYQKFRNVVLPDKAMLDVYRDFPGYRVAGNLHVTHSKKGVITKEFYRVKLINGKKIKNIRFVKSPYGLSIAGV